MKIETIKGRTQLSADDGMWLCNETSKVFAHRVTLGSKSTETMWKEITEEEKTRLETLWGTSDNDNQLTETEQKAKAYDILMGVSE
jgi:hypothetical protein